MLNGVTTSFLRGKFLLPVLGIWLVLFLSPVFHAFSLLFSMPVVVPSSPRCPTALNVSRQASLCLDTPAMAAAMERFLRAAEGGRGVRVPHYHLTFSRRIPLSHLKRIHKWIDR